MTAVLIAGPTASGKSALAVALARALGGTVINADSQQVYGAWRVLTARPTAEEMAGPPHRLYGHVALDAPYSVGHWLAEVAPLLSERWPIITGGTGLYFKALTEGLAPIPEIAPAIRAAGEAELGQLGLAAFGAALTRRDPATAATLDMANPRRVLRAWEVLEATGTGLAGWKARTLDPLMPLDNCIAVALTPNRDDLYTRCDARFDAMLEAGALDEARAVMAMDLPSGTPGLKAVGAPELMAHLRGEMTLARAADRAKTETRRYTKRQLTWIRNQMGAWRRLAEPSPDAVLEWIAARE